MRAWPLSLTLSILLACAGVAHAEQSLYFGDPGGAITVAEFKQPAATSLTITCRFKTLLKSRPYAKLVSRWSALSQDADRGSFLLGFDSPNHLSFSLRNQQGTTKTVVASGTGSTCQLGAWQHVAAVWNGSDMAIYLNGKVVATQKTGDFGPLAATTLPLCIGEPVAQKDRKAAPFEGFISDVSVWNTARDAEAIAKLVTQPLTGREADLAAFFPLSEPAATATVRDHTPAGLTGQLGESLSRVGWCVTPSWNEAKQDGTPVFMYNLSAPPRSEDNKPTIPLSIGQAARHILIGNDKTGQAGVLWQDAATKAIQATWVDADLANHHTVLLPGMSDGILAAGTYAPLGCLYYAVVQQPPADRPESLVLKGAVHLVRPDGKAIREIPLDLSKDRFNYFTPHGRGSMVFAKDTLVFLWTRIMFQSPDGLHHQGGVAATFPADLSTVKILGQTSGHSFGNIMTVNAANEVIGLDLGDNYPRGVHMHRITRGSKASKVVFTFKTAHATTPKDGSPLYAEISHDGKTFYKWSNDNGIYTELGGAVEGRLSYSVIVATDHSPEGKVLDNSRIGIANEPRDLALLRVVKNFEAIPGGTEVSDALMVPGTPQGAPPETGGFFDFIGRWTPQRVTGVIWLTKYKPGEGAHAPHLFRRRDGNILILWEKTGPEGDSLWAMTIHESGRVIVAPAQLGLNLQLNREDPPFRVGNHIFFLAQDRKPARTLLCFVNDDSDAKK